MKYVGTCWRPRHLETEAITSEFGPWATNIDPQHQPALSAYWKQRFAHIRGAADGRGGVSRRGFLALGAAGLAAAGLPTLHGIAASAQDNAADRTELASGRIYVHLVTRPENEGDDPPFRGLAAINPDSGEIEQLVPEGHSHRVDPTRATVAYSKGETIWTNNLDGTAPGKLTDFGGRVVWSPDGQWIIVTDSQLNEEDKKDTPEKPVWTDRTWKMDVSGRNRVPLEIPDTDSVHDWSRDGEWFITVSDRHPPFGRGYQIYRMRPDGREQQRLTTGRGLNVYPRFSPDGQQIVYVYQRRGEGTNIYIMNADGSDPRNITRRQDIGPDACFSPDGRQLAVTMHDWPVTPDGGQSSEGLEQADYRLVIMDTKGNNWRRVNTPPLLWVGHPQWL